MCTRIAYFAMVMKIMSCSFPRNRLVLPSYWAKAHTGPFPSPRAGFAALRSPTSPQVAPLPPRSCCTDAAAVGGCGGCGGEARRGETHSPPTRFQGACSRISNSWITVVPGRNCAHVSASRIRIRIESIKAHTPDYSNGREQKVRCYCRQ